MHAEQSVWGRPWFSFVRTLPRQFPSGVAIPSAAPSHVARCICPPAAISAWCCSGLARGPAQPTGPFACPHPGTAVPAPVGHASRDTHQQYCSDPKKQEQEEGQKEVKSDSRSRGKPGAAPFSNPAYCHRLCPTSSPGTGRLQHTVHCLAPHSRSFCVL